MHILKPTELLVSIIEFYSEIALKMLLYSPSHGKFLLAVKSPEVPVTTAYRQHPLNDAIFATEADSLRIIIRMHGICDEQKLLVVSGQRFVR